MEIIGLQMRELRNSSSRIHVFEVKRSIVYRLDIPEIDIVAKTGSSYISDCVSHTRETEL